MLIPSDRLLQRMHRVISHDLPNQMVALVSLLQLLKAEEEARLSSDGKEYLRRLNNATLRTNDMVRFLKEMERLSALQPTVEAIVLSAMARELQGAFQQQHPRVEFTFDWQWAIPGVVADLSSFVRAVLEIGACYLNGRHGRCLVSGSSRLVEKGTELTFCLEDQTGFADDITPTPVRWNAQTLEQRMEVVLAREWLALSDASVEFALPGSGGVRFAILVPQR